MTATPRMLPPIENGPTVVKVSYRGPGNVLGSRLEPHHGPRRPLAPALEHPSPPPAGLTRPSPALDRIALPSSCNELVSGNPERPNLAT